MLRAAALLVTLAMLAGCASPADVSPLAANDSAASPAGGDGATPPAAGEPLVMELKVSSLVSGPLDDVGAEDASFEVPEGYVAMEAVAEWSCASTVCGYGIILWRDGEEVAREPERTLRADVEAGSYTIGLRSTGPGAGMEGTLTVTLSPGAPPS